MLLSGFCVVWLSHLSLRLYFLLSLVVSCCRAGYVCGRHLKLIINIEGMKFSFNLVRNDGEHRFQLKGKLVCYSTLLHT